SLQKHTQSKDKETKTTAPSGNTPFGTTNHLQSPFRVTVTFGARGAELDQRRLQFAIRACGERHFHEHPWRRQFLHQYHDRRATILPASFKLSSLQRRTFRALGSRKSIKLADDTARAPASRRSISALSRKL